MSSAENWRTARALAHAAGAALPRRAESVGFSDAVGRVLAGPVIARVSLPGFDTAAMDGFAVAGPGPWHIVGRTLAGRPADDLTPGQAVEVATGAATPATADAVIAYEDAEVGDAVLAASPVRPGRHIRRAGEEVATGTEVLAEGRVITPAALSLAAAVGYDELVVAVPPRVSVVITGDEVLPSGVPTPGFVRDALGPALPSMLRSSGAESSSLSYIGDAAAGLLDAVTSTTAELVIVSGSSSVGRADHLEKCLRDLGAQPLVGSVACAPGRTQSMWRLPDGRLVVGLPGNPLAAVVAYLTLVEPLCRGVLNRELPVLAPVMCDIAPHATRTRLVPVVIVGDRGVPTGYDGSAMLRGVADADALAVIEPGSTGHADVLPLPGTQR